MSRVAWTRDHRLTGVRRLAPFFPEFDRVEIGSRPPAHLDAILCASGAELAGWAANLNAPVVRVDDGLLRSIGTATQGAQPVSLIADASSLLSDLRARRDWEDSALLDEARALMAFKATHGLSRTDLGPPLALPPSHDRWIMVVDDAADPVLFGEPGALRADRAEILARARASDPAAGLVLVLGPESPSLTSAEAGLVDHVTPQPPHPMALDARLVCVHTAGGLMGLEAVLAGRRVVCHGVPFYAGWGLTEDLAGPGFAGPARPREALFAAAYILAPRYVDPLTGEACSPRLALERLAVFKRHADRVAGDWFGLNIGARTKIIRAFLDGPKSSFHVRRGRAPNANAFAAWASRSNAAIRRVEADTPDRLAYLEDGFIRSVGLGSGFEPACSIAFDRGGIHFDPSGRSDLDKLMEAAPFSEALRGEARALRADILAGRVSKYNLASDGAGLAEVPPGRRSILVPGQVEDDASVLRGGAGMGNLEVLTRVRQANPDAFILYKEHPDIAACQRPGRIPAARAAALADRVVRGGDIIDFIEAVNEVHTLTSLAGFEALLRQKPVTTYGWPFYAGRGLTHDLGPKPTPRRGAVDLDDLVVGALLLYPLYVDPISWLPCDARTLVARLKALRGADVSDISAKPIGRYLNGVQYLLHPPRPVRY